MAAAPSSFPFLLLLSLAQARSLLLLRQESQRRKRRKEEAKVKMNFAGIRCGAPNITYKVWWYSMNGGEFLNECENAKKPLIIRLIKILIVKVLFFCFPQILWGDAMCGQCAKLAEPPANNIFTSCKKKIRLLCSLAPLKASKVFSDTAHTHSRPTHVRGGRELTRNMKNTPPPFCRTYRFGEGGGGGGC